mgnify:CR=1 FL=1
MMRLLVAALLTTTAAALRPTRACLRRRDLGAATIAAVAALAPAAARAGDPRAQWDAAQKEIDAILQDWPIAGGGDGIRRRIGTVGDTSPLFQIEKSCKKLIPAAEDPEAFAEALENFVSAIARVDGMAYSSNFAGGSGKPSENSATKYIERSRGEVEALKKLVAPMNAALGK